MTTSDGWKDNPAKRYHRVAPFIFWTRGFGMSIPSSVITIMT
ncbi:conserved hypothetical protein [Listeria monocytogenes]|nr:conserved hypothetical protein [Listeria monocytogenes]CUK31154.1 conserved hypothetical protein [Listeria monocytogenes]CUK93056.1 conserved hypothetical protein [Listeria monocytogenes]CUM13706.1 conserved hypothetical protein [Listeria monocytogenes]CUM15974.1 conserved hypothetical protein [Listeria monocytogenes]